MEKFLNLEFLQNLVAFVAPFGTLVLVEIARQSKNKIVSREGPMVISKMYDQYSDLQGSERKTKAREYFKNLFLEFLPTPLKPFVITYFKLTGSKDVQKAYDSYWEEEQKKIEENYQWKGNVEEATDFE